MGSRTREESQRTIPDAKRNVNYDPMETLRHDSWNSSSRLKSAPQGRTVEGT